MLNHYLHRISIMGLTNNKTKEHPMPRSLLKTILCPTCRKLISVDEARCPYCGTSKPGSWMHNNFIARLFNDPARFIKGIIYVNVGMFALAILLSFQGLRLSMNPLTFLSPDNRSLLLLGATGAVPIDNLHRWWTLLSANYLHGGILHISIQYDGLPPDLRSYRA